MDLRQNLAARRSELRGELELAVETVNAVTARLDELDRVLALLPVTDDPAPAPRKRAAKGAVEAGILTMLNAKPALVFSFDEIVAATGRDRSSVRGALKRLVGAGTVIENVHGYASGRPAAVANGEARPEA